MALSGAKAALDGTPGNAFTVLRISYKDDLGQPCSSFVRRLKMYWTSREKKTGTSTFKIEVILIRSVHYQRLHRVLLVMLTL